MYHRNPQPRDRERTTTQQGSTSLESITAKSRTTDRGNHPSRPFVRLLASLCIVLVFGTLLWRANRSRLNGESQAVVQSARAPEAGFVPDAPDPQPAGAADLANSMKPNVRTSGVTRMLTKREEQPHWAVPYGREFWQKPPTASAKANVTGTDAAQELPRDFNFSEVIDRVSAVFRRANDGSDAEVQAFSHTTRLAADGVLFSPYKPAPGALPETLMNAQDGSSSSGVWRSAVHEANIPDPDTELYVHTTALRRGGASGQLQQDKWSVLGNTAQRILSADWQVSEHIQASSAGVEMSWILTAPPPGDGPLVVEAEVIGLTQLMSTNGVHHFADNSGTARVKMGKVVAVDSAGRHFDLTAKMDGNRLNIIVPGLFLANANYPVAIDPTLSAEFGIDQPVITRASDNQLRPQVASNGNGFLVVWIDYRSGLSDIYGARVDASGNLLDSSGLLICDAANYQDQPKVAWNGSHYLVVWADRRDGTTYKVYASRVAPDGTLPDGTGFSVAPSGSAQYEPSVAWNGTDFLVVWREQTGSSTGADIYGRMVHPDGTLAAAPTAICNVANTQYQPDASSDGSNFLVVWTDYRSGSSYDIYGAKLNSAGAVVVGNIPIYTTGNNQQEPRVAWNGSQYLVVFQNDASYNSCTTCCGWGCYTCCTYYSSYQIYATLVGVSGSVGATALIASGNYQYSPAVTSNGSDSLVTWRNGDVASRAYAQRLNSTGGLLGSAFPISSASINSSPTAAWNGSEYLVAFDSSNAASSYDVFARRITAAGSVTDAQDIVLTFGANAEQSVAAASNGTHYFVAWSDNRNGVDYDIYGARLERDGTVLDPTALSISTAIGEQSSPKVASDGNDFLVVWQDVRNPANWYDVYGARVTDAGSVLDPAGIAIRTGSGTQYQPSVASNGSDYLVAWSEYPGASSYDIRGTRVSPAGAVLDPSGISISAASNEQSQPAIASDGANYLVVWSDSRSGAGYDIYGARVSSAGLVQDSSGIQISAANNSQYWPSVAYGNGTYLVAWGDYRSGVGYDVYAARVAPNGTVTDPSGIPLRNTANEESYPAVAWDGSTFLVAWNRYDPVNLYDCEAVEIGADGITSSDGVFSISTTPGQDRLPAVASGAPGEFLLLYQRAGADLGGTRIRARLIRSNSPPAATDQTVATVEDTAVEFVLSVSDPDGDALSFTILTPAAHGTLSGTPPFCTYTPNADYNGTDSFTYTVSDSNAQMAMATVNIEITPVNDPPTAEDVHLTTAEDTPLPFTLTGNDVDGDPLTIFILTQPAHGQVTGAWPNFLYTPAPDFNGSDQFDYQVNSIGYGQAAHVFVTVTPVNDRPADRDRQLTVQEDLGGGSFAGQLQPTRDVDGDALVYSIVTPPNHGQAIVQNVANPGPNETESIVLYQPNPDYNGIDSFTFKCNDGTLDSPVYTYSITIVPVNDAPIGSSQSVTTLEDTSVAITLSGTDSDPEITQALTFTIATGPSHGVLSGLNPSTGQVSYTPDLNYNGPDSFTFTVSDDAMAGGAALTSALAIVNIVVTPVNDPPTADDVHLTTAEDTPLPSTLTGNDVDGDSLTIFILTQPAHGQVTGAWPNFLYTPAANFNGSDQFDYQVNSIGYGQAAHVFVTVTPVNDPPVARSRNVTVAADEHCSADASINDGSFDVDVGDTITITQTPAGPYPLGQTTVTLTVTDNHGASSQSTATVTVQDQTPPTIACPADILVACSSDQFVPVTFSATASDSCDPAPTITYSQAPGSGFPVGITVITCFATDASGNQASCSFTVTRAPLNFAGFLSPFGGADATGGSYASPLRAFKTGTTMPVKFSASCGGAAVLSGIHRLQVVPYVTATAAGNPIDARSQDAATTGDQFRLADGQWLFNLDTKATGMSSGIWQLIATLSDGSTHNLWIQLR